MLESLTDGYFPSLKILGENSAPSSPLRDRLLLISYSLRELMVSDLPQMWPSYRIRVVLWVNGYHIAHIYLTIHDLRSLLMSSCWEICLVMRSLAGISILEKSSLNSAKVAYLPPSPPHSSPPSPPFLDFGRVNRRTMTPPHPLRSASAIHL